jgi:signal transduction histidine kinase
LNFLGKLLIAGEEQSIPVLGSSSLDKGELSNTQNNFQIDFFGLDFRAGETLRYQYKFESERDWSPPLTQQTVTFAKLSPGSYRFLVRAVNSNGAVSETPATVTFQIWPPIWLRWWFISLAVLLTLAIVVIFYRYRITNLRKINAALFEAKSAEENLRRAREDQIKELELVKTRIATDLHDDIGSSLTQIAILSEVARAGPSKTNGDSPDVLQKITDVSNELVGVMSDIVWAINPAKDRFSDLTQRMRRIASDMLSPKDIFVHFRSRDEDKSVVIKTNVRREVFLIFKESITNIAKHSDAKNIFVDLEISNGLLHLRIEDDGKGFGLVKDSLEDTLASDSLGGNGLRNMRKRAAEMSGVFDVESEAGRGTIVRLTLPVEESV